MSLPTLAGLQPEGWALPPLRVAPRPALPPAAWELERSRHRAIRDAVYALREAGYSSDEVYALTGVVPQSQPHMCKRVREERDR